MTNQKRIFSGVQPTGNLHIGGYLGAMKQWIDLQEQEECFFMIADLHALTIPRNPKTFSKDIFELAVEFIATGLDPKKCVIFVQSQVKEHTELTWLLDIITPVSELERMTQYKTKTKQFKENVNVGLLNYPVLQAADILLYQTDFIPVGKDQIQHLELTKTIARKFNQRFGETFKEPKPLLLKFGEKIMALNNPKKKMSKSMPKTCLFLFDEPETIKKKIMSAVTDTGKEIKYDVSEKPGISNLLTIYSFFSKKPINQIEKELENKNYAEFKKLLVELLSISLEPIREKRKELLKEKTYINEVLSEGAEKARAIAQATMKKVREKIGLM